MKAFENCSGFSYQIPLSHTEPVYYRFVVKAPHPRSLIKKAVSRGVACDQPVFRPLHYLLGLPAEHLPNTSLVWRRGVSVPLYPSLTEAEVQRVVQVVRESS